MKQLRFVVSLTNDDNDYQIEQAASAESSARKLNANLQMLYAQNEGVVQSQQLLQIVHAGAENRPDAIIFEPAGGTALPQVARAAVGAGIGWVVLNRETDYLTELRSQYPAPSFAITSDHEEIGRIQGRQIAALLPQGGSVLYIQGPAESLAAKQRTVGMYETKPSNVDVKLMKAQWTEASAHKAVSAWLKLTTSRTASINAIAAQDDSMAMGARKAFHDLPEGEARTRWLSLPFIGCDGLPKTGQAWVRSGMLAATIFTPPNAGLALEMMAQALQGQPVSERTLVDAVSIPTLEVLKKESREKERAASRATAAGGRN